MGMRNIGVKGFIALALGEENPAILAGFCSRNLPFWQYGAADLPFWQEPNETKRVGDVIFCSASASPTTTRRLRAPL